MTGLQAHVLRFAVEAISPIHLAEHKGSAVRGAFFHALRVCFCTFPSSKSVEARERRLVPKVVENFFSEAAPIAGLFPRPISRGSHVYRIGKPPQTLIPLGDQLEPRFGKLGREYQKITFDKSLLSSDPTLEWVAT